MSISADVFLNYEATKAATAERHEALLAAIVETTDDAIISKDLNGIILTWNNAAERMFGYSAHEIIGQSVRRLIPAELQFEEAGILSKIRAGNRIDHYETVRIRKSGERFDASITISPLLDRQNKIIGASKIAREITERKRLEKQLIQSEKVAATGRMAATIAHEINNPLDAVMNLLYLARMSGSFHEARSFIGTAEEELERVALIARQTLGYYRDDGIASQVRVRELIEHVLAVYQGKLSSTAIAVECQFEELPDVIASKGELMQVVSNVVANAIDAMPDGGVLCIHAHKRRVPDGIELAFSDNGVGIKRDDLEKVFEPFFTTKGNLGTGIGLWVVKQLIEARGGQVTVTSGREHAAKGTTVTIFLPIVGPAKVGAES